MNGKVLLDTNIVIALFAGDVQVQGQMEQAAEVFLPSVVLGELYFGARKSGQVEANLARIEELALNSSVLSCDSNTAKAYGIIKNALRTKGRPLPENDIWIAAVAHQFGLTLITRDTHFAEIEDLDIQVW
jgi:tRNA(fMet)-specific endonuclease VapC